MEVKEPIKEIHGDGNNLSFDSKVIHDAIGPLTDVALSFFVGSLNSINLGLSAGEYQYGGSRRCRSTINVPIATLMISGSFGDLMS